MDMSYFSFSLVKEARKKFFIQCSGSSMRIVFCVYMVSLKKFLKKYKVITFNKCAELNPGTPEARELGENLNKYLLGFIHFLLLPQNNPIQVEIQFIQSPLLVQNL